MSITKKDLIDHASIFEFRYGKFPSPSDRVTIEKSQYETHFYHWVIKWGGSIWSKKEQMFLYEVPLSERTENFGFELEDAFGFLNNNNPIELHRKRLKELKII